MAKHFLKVLTIFLMMIVLGLIGVFAVDYFDHNRATTTDANTSTGVAE